MAPKARISQEAFDAAVRENVEEFGMEEDEARADAVHTFKLQGVDLSGIIIHGGVDPVVEAVQRLKQALDDVDDDGDDFSLQSAMEKLREAACTAKDVAIAARNGAVEKCICTSKYLVASQNKVALSAALRTLDHLLTDEQGKAEFASCGGPEVIAQALLVDDDTGSVPGLAAGVIGLGASGNERVKDEFMHLKVESSLLELIRKCGSQTQVLTGACSALRALVAADDNSVPASNAFRNARKIVKAGGVEVVLEASCFSRSDPALLATLCATLKALAVNEEACKLIAASNGVESVLQFVEDSVKTGNKNLAKTSCTLLAQFAGSDENKDAIVSRGGCQTLVSVASFFVHEATVVQEVFFALASLTLRSPTNASKALDAGVVDLAVEAMNRHPQTPGINKQACQMLRNMAVRNPEHRPIILEKGVEKLIREVKSRHPSCKDAASAALRDLGLENYND